MMKMGRTIMKKCSVCGTENEDAFTTCLICGSPLKEAVTDQNEQENGEETVQYVQSVQDNQYGYGQPVQNQGMYNAAPQPIKSNKKKILGIWCGMLVVTVVVLFLLFGIGGGKAKGGVSSPEKVAQDFIEAMDSADMTRLKNLCPPFLDDNVDELEESLDELAVYNTGFKYVGISDSYEYSDSDLNDLEDEIQSYYNARVEVDAAVDMTVEYKLTMSYLGESYSEDEEETLTAIKYKGKWFIYE
jgi:uncharacterized membrane protein YvbJ